GSQIVGRAGSHQTKRAQSVALARSSAAGRVRRAPRPRATAARETDRSDLRPHRDSTPRPTTWLTLGGPGRTRTRGLECRSAGHCSSEELESMHILGSNPVLAVHDLDQSAAWFTRVLGCERSDPDPGNWAFCRAGAETFTVG